VNQRRSPSRRLLESTGQHAAGKGLHCRQVAKPVSHRRFLPGGGGVVRYVSGDVAQRGTIPQRHHQVEACRWWIQIQVARWFGRSLGEIPRQEASFVLWNSRRRRLNSESWSRRCWAASLKRMSTEDCPRRFLKETWTAASCAGTTPAREQGTRFQSRDARRLSSLVVEMRNSAEGFLFRRLGHKDVPKDSFRRDGEQW